MSLPYSQGRFFYARVKVSLYKRKSLFCFKTGKAFLLPYVYKPFLNKEGQISYLEQIRYTTTQCKVSEPN